MPIFHFLVDEYPYDRNAFCFSDEYYAQPAASI